MRISLSGVSSEAKDAESLLTKEEISYYPDRTSRSQTPMLDRLWRLLKLVVPYIFCLIFGGWLGRHLPWTGAVEDFPITIGSVVQVWQLNTTFAQSPTPDSEEAWSSLMPLGRGFIQEPRISPNVSGLAVFHQLHCLHALLIAHYSLESRVQFLEKLSKFTDDTSSSNEYVFETYGAKLDEHHVYHCFDYLRQSLMCAADVNLEVVDENSTVNGWNQVKYCRNFEQIYQIAEMWRDSDDRGIVTTVED